MFDKTSNKKLAGIILAGVLAVTGVITAFAADQAGNSQPPVNQNRPVKMDSSKMSATIKTAIDGLLTAGTITQAQADAVTKAYTPGEGNQPEDRKNPIDELVTAGTITQAQADAINTAIKAGREAKKNKEAVLKELVTAGTITQAQADAVTKAYTPGEKKNDLQGDNMNNGVIIIQKEQLDSLVDAGTITQAQADAIQELSKSNESLKGVRKFGHDNQLAELVTAGTITQAQADAIKAAIKSAMDSSDKQ